MQAARGRCPGGRRERGAARAARQRRRGELDGAVAEGWAAKEARSAGRCIARPPCQSCLAHALTFAQVQCAELGAADARGDIEDPGVSDAEQPKRSRVSRCVEREARHARAARQPRQVHRVSSAQCVANAQTARRRSVQLRHVDAPQLRRPGNAQCRRPRGQGSGSRRAAHCAHRAATSRTATLDPVQELRSSRRGKPAARTKERWRRREWWRMPRGSVKRRCHRSPASSSDRSLLRSLRYSESSTAVARSGRPLWMHPEVVGQKLAEPRLDEAAPSSRHCATGQVACCRRAAGRVEQAAGMVAAEEK